MRRSPRIFLCVIAACVTSYAAPSTLDPLVQVSGASPFVDCHDDFIEFQPGTVYVGSEVEPWLTVNPRNPLNIVGAWQQDRWSNGGSRGLAAGVSFDGGLTWRSVVVPGLTPCSGGSLQRFQRVSDPWISFAANGDLYYVSLGLGFIGPQTTAILVSKSTDGGLTWSDPATLAEDQVPVFHDKEAIAADPNDPNLVYAVWDRLHFDFDIGPAVFARSTDGGATWEPPRVLYDPGPGNQTIANQIVVQPDGTVIDFFTEIIGLQALFLSYKISHDKGLTWEPAVGAYHVASLLPRPAIDPDGGTGVRDGSILFDVAVDPRNGWLFAVWQDARFSGFQYGQVAFSLSKDGGATWSAPVPVDRTPAGIEPLNRQAFLPSVQVSDNGTIGVSYYDFRLNDPAPGAATDHWFTWCHPQASDCANPARWREDLRLTDASFDVLQAPVAEGLFLGDYVGLASAGADFLALFTQPHGADRSSAFFRRIVLDDTVDPQEADYWKQQVRLLLSGRGGALETEQSLLASLDDIHALYGVFDDVHGLAGLESVLMPRNPSGPHDQAERQLMALLLNLTSYRIPPYTVVAEHETAADAISGIVTAIENAQTSNRDLEEARKTAQDLNHGMIPLRR